MKLMRDGYSNNCFRLPLLASSSSTPLSKKFRFLLALILQSFCSRAHNRSASNSFRRLKFLVRISIRHKHLTCTRCYVLRITSHLIPRLHYSVPFQLQFLRQHQSFWLHDDGMQVKHNCILVCCGSSNISTCWQNSALCSRRSCNWNELQPWSFWPHRQQGLRRIIGMSSLQRLKQDSELGKGGHILSEPAMRARDGWSILIVCF